MMVVPISHPEQSRYKHDSDLDDIINEHDLCPLEPEDYDGDLETKTAVLNNSGCLKE